MPTVANEISDRRVVDHPLGARRSHGAHLEPTLGLRATHRLRCGAAGYGVMIPAMEIASEWMFHDVSRGASPINIYKIL